MTAQLSRERLEEIRDTCWMDDLGLSMSELSEMARMLLAGMDSEPVAVIDKEGSPMTRAECNDDRVFAICCKVGTPLYAAPPAPVMPGELHPDTQKLVADFCAALAEKLYKAQLKYGYDVDWKQDGWPSQCQAHFHQHIAKGDPRDVAAYCAFMWYHGWKTDPAPVAVPDVLEQLRSIVADPRALPRRKELISGQRYSYVLLEEVEAIVDNACRAAMLNAGPVTGWIKCSERMPEEGGRYWCYVEEQNSLGKSHYQWNCSWNGDEWSDKALTGRVTHWMALPAAPEQEV